VVEPPPSLREGKQATNVDDDVDNINNNDDDDDDDDDDDKGATPFTFKTIKFNQQTSLESSCLSCSMIFQITIQHLTHSHPWPDEGLRIACKRCPCSSAIDPPGKGQVRCMIISSTKNGQWNELLT